VFIRTEVTPNPNAIKFVTDIDEFVFSNEASSFDRNSTENIHQLAEALLTIVGISGVFLNGNFVSVTKHEETEWVIIKPQILSFIMDYVIAQGSQLQEENSPKSKGKTNANVEKDTGSTDTSDPIVKLITDLIEERVRPNVAMDGGDILFRGYKDGIVFVSLHGACSGCPSSTITLKNGVESMLKHYVPEIKSVESI